MEEHHALDVLGAEALALPGGKTGLVIRTSGGDIACLYHPDQRREGAVVWVGGAAGGFSGPAGGIYADLATALAEEGLRSLRLHYRRPGDFTACVLDVLAGLSYLRRDGVRRAALVGHSFGGAVAIAAGALSPLAVAVVGLSSQTYGARSVDRLAPRALLLVHGGRDQRLPPRCSEQVYAWAKEPKGLVIYPEAGHSLYQCRDALRDLLQSWLLAKVKGL